MLSLFLLLSRSAVAQEPVFVPGAQPPTAGQRDMSSGSPKAAPGIRILILEGQRRVNRLTEGIFAVPVVEVRDSNDKPLEGAKVQFTLSGGAGSAGAAFPDGSVERVFMTNSQGQASAEGYRPNNVEGKFTVKVKAEYQQEISEVTITQVNTFQTQADADVKKSKAWRKWVYIGGAAAAGGITAAVLLSRGSSSGPGVITVVPGQPILGGR